MGSELNTERVELKEEIERLTALGDPLDTLRNFFGDMTIKMPIGRAIGEIERLREEASYFADEIERMREALEKIIKCESQFSCDELERACWAVSHCQEIARAALEVSDGKEEDRNEGPKED